MTVTIQADFPVTIFSIKLIENDKACRARFIGVVWTYLWSDGKTNSASLGTPDPTKRECMVQIEKVMGIKLIFFKTNSSIPECARIHVEVTTRSIRQ